MDLQHQKLELIEWLAGLNDSSLIDQFLSLKNKVESENEAALQKALDKALDQVKHGKTTPHNVVMQDLRSKYGA